MLEVCILLLSYPNNRDKPHIFKKFIKYTHKHAGDIRLFFYIITFGEASKYEEKFFLYSDNGVQKASKSKDIPFFNG